MAGVQVPLWTDQLKFVGDYVSGNHARSLINLGLGLKLSNQWSVIGAATLPAPNSGNKPGGTIQFSYTGK